jgi:hypothetical protein
MNPPDFTPDPNAEERFQWLAEVRELAVKGSWKAAVAKIQTGLKVHEPQRTEEEAQKWLRAQQTRFCDADDYISAGLLQWSRGMFEPGPEHVQRIFYTLSNWDLICFVGASGLGKSMSPAQWMAMDYWYDAQDTGIKLVSVSDTNLKGNCWAKMCLFLSEEACLFPIDIRPPNTTRMRMFVRGSRSDCGIEAILVGRTTEATGKVKGWHTAQNRPVMHPKFGKSTRIRMLLDEAQSIPEGVKDDLNSPKASLNSRTHAMKIVMTMNLDSALKWAVKEAEPATGWSEELMDKVWDWNSPKGWRVCRVDSRRTENIRQRKEIFPGFPTIENEKQYLNGSMRTASWYTFWAGWIPQGVAAEVVIPPSWFDQAIGEPIFVGKVSPVAGVDPSYDRDVAVLALGRYGLASGWLDGQGVVHQFSSRTSDKDEVERRHVCVLDQLIRLESKDPVAMAKEVRAWCERVGVQPDHLCGDRTGAGVGTTGHLSSYWDRIIAINWKQTATQMRIIAEHTDGADVHCATIIDEMYYTVRTWIPQTVRGFFINPICDHIDHLKHELTTRQFKYGTANRFQVESKEAYTKRGNQSPGWADATIMMVHVPRVRGYQLPAMVDENVVTKKAKRPEGHQDKVSYANVSLSGGQQTWVKPELDRGEVKVPDDWRMSLR